VRSLFGFERASAPGIRDRAGISVRFDRDPLAQCFVQCPCRVATAPAADAEAVPRSNPADFPRRAGDEQFIRADCLFFPQRPLFCGDSQLFGAIEQHRPGDPRQHARPHRVGYQPAVNYREQVACRALADDAAIDEDRLICARGNRLIFRQDVGEQRDGLDPAPMPPLVGDGPEPYSLAGSRGRERRQRPGVKQQSLLNTVRENVVPRRLAAGELQVDHSVLHPAGGDQFLNLLSQRDWRDGQSELNSPGGSLKPGKMLRLPKGFAVVQPQDFIDSVGKLKPAIFDAQPGFGHRDNLAIEPDAVVHGISSI